MLETRSRKLKRIIILLFFTEFAIFSKAVQIRSEKLFRSALLYYQSVFGSCEKGRTVVGVWNLRLKIKCFVYRYQLAILLYFAAACNVDPWRVTWRGCWSVSNVSLKPLTPSCGWLVCYDVSVPFVGIHIPLVVVRVSLSVVFLLSIFLYYTVIVFFLYHAHVCSSRASVWTHITIFYFHGLRHQ